MLATAPEVSGIEIDAVAEPSLAESTPLIGATRAWSAGFTERVGRWRSSTPA